MASRDASPPTSNPRDTPAMRQFLRFKQAHPGCVLLFRIGDFYETFDDDAVTISKALGLTLTRRTEGLPMAGVPHHQIETYLRRLIDQGFRVAVCDQIQEAKDAKGLIERAVTRVLSPGTLVDESLLDERSPGRLAAIACEGLGTQQRIGLAVVEASTGAFAVTEIGPSQLVDELTRRGVTELIHSDQAGGLIGSATGGSSGAGVAAAIASAAGALGLAVTPRPAWHFRSDEACEILLKHFRVGSLAGFGLEGGEPAMLAAGAVLRYLLETQAPMHDLAANGGGATGSCARPLAHLQPPRRDALDDACVLDAVTLRALEIERTLRPVAAGSGLPGKPGQGLGGDGSLLGVFLGTGSSACKTAMGKRLLREWLCRPLREPAAIRARHACVASLVEDRRLADELVAALSEIQDIARIAGRLAIGRATPRDLVALGSSIRAASTLLDTIRGVPALQPIAEALASVLPRLLPIAERIRATCVDAPPPHLREGGLVRDGVDGELDEARRLRLDATGWLSEYQARLIAELRSAEHQGRVQQRSSGITSSCPRRRRRAPASFTRKQTLKNAERYTTPEFEGV
jgi:DNA mismatch repair protein MutS